MAKGQVRGNKETRKPKKDKVEKSSAPLLGSQVKSAESNIGSGKKK